MQRSLKSEYLIILRDLLHANPRPEQSGISSRKSTCKPYIVQVLTRWLRAALSRVTQRNRTEQGVPICSKSEYELKIISFALTPHPPVQKFQHSAR